MPINRAVVTAAVGASELVAPAAMVKLPAAGQPDRRLRRRRRRGQAQRHRLGHPDAVDAG